MPGPPAPQPGSTSGKQRVHPQLTVCFFYLEYRATPNNIWAFSEVKSRIFLVTGANAYSTGFLRNNCLRVGTPLPFGLAFSLERRAIL